MQAARKDEGVATAAQCILSAFGREAQSEDEWAEAQAGAVILWETLRDIRRGLLSQGK